MSQFVFLFRKNQKTLPEAEQKSAGEEGRAWGVNLLKDGRNLDVRLLGRDADHTPPEGEQGAGGEWPIVAIDFLQANDFAEAVKIAKTHPGIRHGISVEVRPWAPPPAWPPSAN